jgi:hypothetical protein
VIFLDIDGVLAPIRRWDRYGDLEPACIDVLNEIVTRGGADVVVSSTWRHGKTVAELQAMLDAAGFAGCVLDATPGDMHGATRGEEIAAWLAKHAVAGYVIVDDLSVPHENFYRPSVRFKALDGSCVIGVPVTRARIADPDALAVCVYVDGELVQRTDTGARIRSMAQLLADISDFMTLSPGDIVLLGTSHGAPSARAGQRVAIEIDGLGRLETRVVAAAERKAGR